jgi:hypothetical protein
MSRYRAPSEECVEALNVLATKVTDTIRSQPLGPFPRRGYVIELDVPKHSSVLGCVYVGESSRTAQERFEQHRAGYKAARDVKNYGVQIRPELYEMLPPVPPRFAKKLEEALGKVLRDCGYCVHGAH